MNLVAIDFSRKKLKNILATIKDQIEQEGICKPVEAYVTPDSAFSNFLLFSNNDVISLENHFVKHHVWILYQNLSLLSGSYYNHNKHVTLQWSCSWFFQKFHCHRVIKKYYLDPIFQTLGLFPICHKFLEAAALDQSSDHERSLGNASPDNIPHRKDITVLNHCYVVLLLITSLTAWTTKICLLILQDISVKFNMLDQSGFIGQLQNKYNRSANVLYLFQSYLTGRTQHVSVNSQLLDKFPLCTVVPQGCFVGPCYIFYIISQAHLHLF